MRIVISARRVPFSGLGGGQSYVYGLFRELHSRSHRVIIIGGEEWREGPEKYRWSRSESSDESVATFAVKPGFLTNVENHLKSGATTHAALENVLRNCQPDIVHTNAIKPALVHACREPKLPHVTTVHHSGIICPAGNLLKPDIRICRVSVNLRDCVPCSNYWRQPKWHTGRIIAKIPTMLYRRLGERLNARRNLSCLERGLIYLNNRKVKRNDYGKIL